MPFYDYSCPECKQIQEVLLKYKESDAQCELFCDICSVKMVREFPLPAKRIGPNGSTLPLSKN